MVKGPPPGHQADPAKPGWLAALADKLSPTPDWSGTLPIVLATVFVAVLACVIEIRFYMHGLPVGDTDDALRLVIVRDLVAGRGWYDQAIMRLDPPHGVWMHWSRLLDGGIAGLILLFRQFTSPASAEYWARYVWPLLWVFPGVAGALVIARNLGGRSAVMLTAILLLFDVQLYRQFHPGRIDHHNIQIVMAVIAMACATATKDRARWAILGGAAAGLGLAIGLEAMPLQALIGASYGLALMRDRKAAAPAAAYGLALAAATAALFAIQTPPWRWGMAFCDALAINLVAGVAVAGLGLAIAAAAAPRAPAWGRFTLVAIAAVAAGAVYLGLDPQCIHGPFAALDPAVRPFWFDRIQEIQPLPTIYASQREAALVAAIALAMSLASAIYLAARQWRSPSTSTLLILASLTLASVTAWFAWRMQDYVFWIGLPVVGAAASFIARRWTRDLMVPSAFAAMVLAPSTLGIAANATLRVVTPPAQKWIDAGPKCFAPRAYGALAALPAGNVLAPQDLGPFILDLTGDSVIAAPYHRMSRQILEVHQFWNARPAQAEAHLRALHPDYVVDCPPYPLVVGPKSFGTVLRHGAIPPWLLRLSPPKATLQIYRVLPPAT